MAHTAHRKWRDFLRLMLGLGFASDRASFMLTIRTLLLASPILFAACGGSTAERNAPDGGHGSSAAASGGSSAQTGAGGHAPSGQGGQGAFDPVPRVIDGGPAIDGGSCTAGPMRQIHYVSRDPEACNAIRYTCPANTDYYSDEYCGCGCIQDPDCPTFVDCEPTVPPSPKDPLCTDTARCPYAQRAF